AFTTVGSMPTAGNRDGSVEINGWLYSFKSPDINAAGRFEYAQLCSTGTLCGTWKQGAWPPLGSASSQFRDAFSVVAVSSNIFIAGAEDYDCGIHSDVNYLTVCSTGTA